MLAVSTATFAQGCSDGGMVDTQDLKSCDHNGCAGSSPAPSTIIKIKTESRSLKS